MNVNREYKQLCGEVFRILSDESLLECVKDEIREAIPTDENDFDELLLWRSLASKGEQKAFVCLLVGDGRDWRDACRGATGARRAGASCGGDLGKGYENFGRYVARKQHVYECLKDPDDGFDYGKFGSLQEDLHRGKAVASAVVGERLIFDDEIEDCIS